MNRRDDPQLDTPVPRDELSLDAILAEYGRGGRQPAPAPETPPAPTPPPEPEPVPVPDPAPIPEPEPVPAPDPVPAPLSDTPDRVSLKDVMSQTVDAVLEDE